MRRLYFILHIRSFTLDGEYSSVGTHLRQRFSWGRLLNKNDDNVRDNLRLASEFSWLVNIGIFGFPKATLARSRSWFKPHAPSLVRDLPVSLKIVEPVSEINRGGFKELVHKEVGGVNLSFSFFLAFLFRTLSPRCCKKENRVLSPYSIIVFSYSRKFPLLSRSLLSRPLAGSSGTLLGWGAGAGL